MKKIKGLSLFANVGIAEAYMEEVGVDIVLANELLPKRASFYEHVYPTAEMICGDIVNEDIRNTIVNSAVEKGIDFIIATPPCQGMSEAGSRNEFDERNQLIFYAIDIIKRVKPKYILLENVPKQLTTKIKIDDEIVYIPEYIKRELSNDYDFNIETLVRAKDHGVPQLRERNIFLLTLKDLKLNWKFPQKESEITLKEAIGHLPILDPLLREGIEETIKKFPKYLERKKKAEAISKWHTPPKHSWKQVEWMLHTPTGKSAIYNEVHYPQKDGGVPVKAHHNHYRRLKWDMPCRTITQNSGVMSSLCCVHPGRVFEENGQTLYSDPRVLTIYELMIVSSLPLDWNIPDWADSTLIRNVIGEGIPPMLIKKIMLELIEQL